MTWLTNRCVILAGLTLLWIPAMAQVTITYTGNMGVLLESSEHAVLIDGLHEFYKPAYLPPSEKLVADLLQEGGNYPVPDLSLVTHYHGDHYSSQLHLGLRKTTVVGSRQVTDPLKQKSYAHTITIPYDDYRINEYQFEGMQLQAFRMDHGNEYLHKNVQNIGYLISIGGKSILHVGDTDWYEHVFDALQLPLETIDLAILPYWLLWDDQGPQWVDQYIKPKRLLLTHIDPNISPADLKELRHKLPGVEIFTVLGQAIVVE